MSDQQQVEYQNENLKLVVKKQPNCRVTFEISVTSNATEAAYRKATKNVSKEVSIPGFRKGKAPEKVIAEHFSKDIEQEWRRLVVHLAFNDSVKLSNCHPLDHSPIDKPVIKHCARSEGAEIAISFEHKPDIPKIDPKTLHIRPVPAPEITQEHTDQELQSLRNRFGEYKKLERETVEEGDVVVLDVDTVDQNETVVRACSDERFVVKQGVLAPWLHQLLIGGKVGQTLEGQPKLSEENSTEPVRCRVLVKEILDHVLPEVDQALAKKVGCADTTELYANITKSLQARAEQWAQSQLMLQLEDQILENYPIELPSSLLENAISVSVKNTIYGLKKLSMPEEKIQSLKTQIHADARTRNERELKLLLLLENIVDEQKIRLTRDELLKELRYQEYLASPDERVINSEMAPEEISQRVANVLFLRKAKQFLLEKAIYDA